MSVPVSISEIDRPEPPPPRVAHPARARGLREARPPAVRAQQGLGRGAGGDAAAGARRDADAVPAEHRTGGGCAGGQPLAAAAARASTRAPVARVPVERRTALKAPARSSDTRIDELQTCAPRRPPKRTGGRGGDIGCRLPARADIAGSGMFHRQAVRRTGASPRTGRLRVPRREVEHHARDRESAHLGGRARDRVTDLSRGRRAGVPQGRLPAVSQMLRCRASKRTRLRPGGGTFIRDALQPPHHVRKADGTEHAGLRREL